MYKLLIADDEARIRKGLRNSLIWEKLNIKIVGEAEDGEIALEMTKRLNPDIILLDICMPFLNGLELIKKLTAADRECLVIVITGHDEFDYMHEALKLKVFDYILKPVKKEELKETIDKALLELSKQEKKKVYLDWASRQLGENKNVLEQKFLSDWFNGKISSEQVINELDFFKIKIENDIGMIVIKVIDRLNYEVYSKDWDRDLLNFALINIAEEILSEFKPKLTYIDENNNIVIICNICSTKGWLDIGNAIENKIYSYLHYTVVMEQKKIFGGILDIQKIYKEMVAYIEKISEYKPVVVLAIRFIESNYFVADLSLDMVSEKFNVSTSYLSRLLKQDTGMSFIDYLTSVRIKRSICMMDDPTLKIYEIAEAIGYSNQHYFCKAFKKVKGFSPSEYRGGNSN